jgi:FtsP/CotA-like multicopper oxidase with cupredoxin domain
MEARLKRQFSRAGALLAVALTTALLAACGERAADSAARGEAASPAVAAGAGAARARDVSQPAGWDEELALEPAADLDPDPHVLEIALEAKPTQLELLPGKSTSVWAYNGRIPGPLIRAKVGDRLVVHFKNSLPVETTVHWHGLRVPNDMDGAPGVTQQPIAPGAEFRYDFVLRDAGTYWYHPHQDSAVQVGRGLYGAIVVEDPNDPKELGDDLVLLLSDISLDEDGQLQADDSGGKFGDLFGREGSVLLVNGKVRPHLKVRAGKQQRWRVINAARARYFNLRLPDHRFVRLGGDNGLAARSEDVYNVVVAPGERTDAVFTPRTAPGTQTVFQWVPFDRGYGSTYNRPREDLFVIDTVDEPAVAPEQIPEVLRTIEPIELAGATERTLELNITLGNNDVVMGVNNVPYWRSKPIEVRLGETEIWKIVNQTDFAHPFHLHGYFFQVLDDTRVPEWKDTVNVPSKSELRIAVKFDERPGAWMFHCHILDHAEAGMMGHLQVIDPSAPAPSAPPGHSGMTHTHSRGVDPDGPTD